MFGAIGRWIKAVGYLLTGQIDSARRVLDTNPTHDATDSLAYASG